MIHIFQPALPAYRIDFFERLASHYEDRICVHYSQENMGVLTAPHDLAAWEHPIGPILRPIRGVEWQVGALSVPLKRGDIVVSSGAPRNLSTLLLLAKARLKGARTIWWGHYWSATSEPRRHRLRMQLSKLADALLFYTDTEVARFHSDGWTHPGPVGALNNGIDLKKVLPLRRAYDPAERNNNILFIGRLTEKAQLSRMVSALAHPELAFCNLHVIGDGPQETVLRAQATVHGAAERITWHGGATDEEYIAKIANCCAVFVYPGQVGLSLIHAMGYGLPCIVHHNSLRHMPEIAAFEEGATGVTFCEGDTNSLAIAVSSLLDAQEARTRMSMHCRSVTKKNYTTDGMAERFIEFIERILELENTMSA